MKRNQRGQSLVEYALGLGCIAALCMVAISSLGHISGHITANVNNAFNSASQTAHPEEMVNLESTPWTIQ